MTIIHHLFCFFLCRGVDERVVSSLQNDAVGESTEWEGTGPYSLQQPHPKNTQWSRGPTHSSYHWWVEGTSRYSLLLLCNSLLKIFQPFLSKYGSLQDYRIKYWSIQEGLVQFPSHPVKWQVFVMYTKFKKKTKLTGIWNCLLFHPSWLQLQSRLK